MVEAVQEYLNARITVATPIVASVKPAKKETSSYVSTPNQFEVVVDESKLDLRHPHEQ